MQPLGTDGNSSWEEECVCAAKEGDEEVASIRDRDLGMSKLLPKHMQVAGDDCACGKVEHSRCGRA